MKKKRKIRIMRRKKHDEDDDVENEDDQRGRKKGTANYLSTLHPPPKTFTKEVLLKVLKVWLFLGWF